MKAKDVKTTNPKILFYGPAGSGKTGLVAQASGGYMIDCDNGMLTAVNLNDKFTKYRHEIEFDTLIDENPNMPKSWIKIKEKLYKINRECRAGTWPYDCLVIDSITRMGLACTNQVMAQANKTGEAPQLQHYNSIVSDMRFMLQLITSLPTMVLAATHELLVETDDMTYIKARATGQKLPDEIVCMFDEVWYTKVKKVPASQGHADYIVSCLPTTCRDSRTRSGKLAEYSFKDLGLRGLLKEMGYTYSHEPKPEEKG